MKKAKTVIYFSVILIILPFLGFPYEWDRFITIFLGIVFLFVGIGYYNREKQTEDGKEKTQRINFPENPVFVESKISKDEIYLSESQSATDEDEGK